MKLRSDFVSNSSSSSFVVLHKDNKYGLILSGKDVEHLNLHRFLEMFGKSEFLGWNMSSDEEMEFVDDTEFINRFLNSTGSGKYLPKSCKEKYDKICSICLKRKELHNKFKNIAWNDPRIEKLLDEEEKLEQSIIDDIEDTLSSTYGNETFDYVSVSDYEEPIDRIDECWSLEDQTIKKIKFAKSVMPNLKFCRISNMH